jgi:Fe2+ transport system protein FeoA
MFMLLSECAPGQKGIILKIDSEKTLKQRMTSMGIVPGINFELISEAPFGDPIALKIKNYKLSLRKFEASHITVKLEEKQK